MFTEWSKGSSLQRTLSSVLTRLAPILGFKMRVTERGGTELSSLLSSKDLWRGQHCGRGLCVTCRQREVEPKQPCKMRNVVYESECVLCNPISRDKLEKEVDLLRRGQASLYVGETSKSIYGHTMMWCTQVRHTLTLGSLW